MKIQSQPSRRIQIVAALITDIEGQILLVRKRGTRYFMQPGGKAEPDETAEETLAREILEELGCAIRPDSIRYKGRFVAEAANEPDHEVDAAIFKVEILGEPIAQAEIAELVWLKVNNPEGLMLAPLTRDHVLPLA